jgi:hypothetical protein
MIHQGHCRLHAACWLVLQPTGISNRQAPSTCDTAADASSVEEEDPLPDAGTQSPGLVEVAGMVNQLVPAMASASITGSCSWHT